MKNKFYYFKYLMLISCIIFFFTSSLSAQQSSEIKKLEVKLVELENRNVKLNAKIIELEKRVAKLEALLETSSKSEIKYSEKWKNRSLWRKLKIGMSKYQVENLLGEPRKIDGGSFLTFWYYAKSGSHSSVSFDDDGRVCGWTEPE